MNATARTLTFLTFVILGGCSKTTDERAQQAAKEPSPAPNAPFTSLTVTSTGFAQGSMLPSRFTCEGEDVAPPLAWSDPPAGTKSFAVVVEDPDAPKKTFVHWIVYGLPPTARGLPEGTKSAPPGTRDGENDFGRSGYGGPCPPSGRHRYVFNVYALDIELPDLNKPHASDLDRAMNGHVLARGTLVGTYEKGQAPRM